MTSKQEAAFGARLRRLRLQKELSQRDLAEPLYTAAYISTVEAGKRRPSRPALEHFAKRLGVEVDELLTGKPPDLEARMDLQLAEARVAISAGDLATAGRAAESVKREAKRYGLIAYTGRACEVEARCAEHKGDFEAASDLYGSVLELLADQAPVARTTSVTGMARLAHQGGNSHYAIHLLERFLVELVASDLPEPTALMSVHAGLVLPYFDVGMRDRAALHAEEALKFLSEAKDPFEIAMMHVQVARVLLSEGHIKDAEASLTRAEDLFKSLDMRTEFAIARLAHGYALGHAGQLLEAEVLLRSALEVFEDVGRVLERARATNELARIFRLQDRGSEVEPLLEQSLDLLEGSDPGELAITHRELGLCAGVHDPKKAEKSLRRAIELFELGEDKVQLAATYGLLGELMRATGRPAQDECESYRAGALQFVEPGDGFGPS